MTLRVGDILRPASITLFDVTNTRWNLAELAQYASDGQRMVVLLRPDSNAVNKAVQLVGGTKQSIPSDGIAFLRAVRNMGSNGAVPGRAIRAASRDSLDNEIPDWHYSNPKAVVEHYVFDSVNPLNFYVYPCVSGTLGAAAGTWVEVIYSGSPGGLTANGLTLDTNGIVNLGVGDALTIGDQYGPMLIEYVLSRAYAKDASYAGNVQRATTHMTNFANGLQVTMQAINSAIGSAGQPAVAT